MMDYLQMKSVGGAACIPVCRFMLTSVLLAFPLLFSLLSANLGFSSVMNSGFIQTKLKPTELALSGPLGIAIDSSDILYLSTIRDNRVYSIDLKSSSVRIMSSLAANMGVSEILIPDPFNVILSYPFRCRVVNVNIATDRVTDIAGKEKLDVTGYHCASDGDNDLAVKASLEPDSMALGPEGNLIILDGFPDGRLRKVDKHTGIISSLVAASQLDSAVRIAVDSHGNIYIAQSGNGSPLLMSDSSTGALSVLKSSSFGGNKDFWKHSMKYRRVVCDKFDNLYLLDSSHIYYLDVKRRYVSLIAGTALGFAGDGGPAKQAKLYWPEGLALDSHNNIYVTDSENQRIRRIDAQTHVITTVAGNGKPDHMPGKIELQM